MEATGVIDPSEYRMFIEQLNFAGGQVDSANEVESRRRVLFSYVALPLMIIGGLIYAL